MSQFSIEEHPDYQCPYDWLRIEFADGSFQALCGDTKPGNIASNRNWVHIVFHSDKDENRKGFRLRYSLESKFGLLLESITGFALPIVFDALQQNLIDSFGRHAFL